MPPAARHLQQAQRALRDGGTARFVARARLTLPRREDEPRVRFALEDALRTADFGDCGRLILVRALRLGRLAPQAGSAQIARAIEAAWREAAPHALPFTDPRAAQAPAVFFRSAHHARLEWLERAAHGEPLDAWFWTRALPEIAFTDTLAEAVAAVLVAAAETAPEELAAQIGAWPQPAVQRLVAALPAEDSRVVAALAAAFPSLARTAPQALATLLGAWPANAVQRLMRLLPVDARAIEALLPPLACGQALPPETRPARPAAPGSPAGRTAIDRLPGASAAVRRAALRLRALELRPGDPRAKLAAALFLRRELAAAPASEHVEQAVRQAAQTSEAMTPGDAEESRPAAASVMPDLPADPALSFTAVSLPQEKRSAADAQRAQPSGWPWLEDSVPTQYGGFLMLLNALSLLRFDEWLEQQTGVVRQCFGHALLGALADRLRMPADDPQRALLRLADDETVVLSDAAWAAAMRSWRRVLRRAMRLQARIGIASAVRRRAGISITPTHVDVVMPLEEIDLRLRRAGLDSDPGWVPWFGRIVAFHFVAGASGDA